MKVIGIISATLAGLLWVFAHTDAPALVGSKPVPTITAPAAAPPFGVVLKGAIAGPCDADTLFVELRMRVKIRFSELDAPEISTPKGKKAAEEIAAKAPPGTECTVWLKGPDTAEEIIGNGWSFERWVGRVWLKGDSVSLGNWQIKQGNVK